MWAHMGQRDQGRRTQLLVLALCVCACRWRSFHRGGSVAFYITLYALGFLFSSLASFAGAMPVFIYLCYMAIFILGFYFTMATICFGASLWFVNKIFRAVKAD